MDTVHKVIKMNIDRNTNNFFVSPFMIATVVNNQDPELAYRIQVRIPNIHDNLPDDILPWAGRMGPTFLGFGDSDLSHAIPEVGTQVLILAINNNPNSLLYVGSVYSKNNSAPKGDEYLNNYGIYTRNGEFIGVEKVSNVFHMIWNGDLTFDVQGKIKIGNKADEPMVLGRKLEVLLQQMITTFNSHTHTGNLALPTSTPTPPSMQYTDVTSKKIIVE
jgi:hypothetical protein